MQLALKIILTVAVILAATGLARRFPPLSGLIGVMPLAGAMLLAWIYVENRDAPQVVEGYVRGALWGIVPSILFYLAAWWCLRRGLGIVPTMVASFGMWGLSALVHQLLIK